MKSFPSKYAIVRMLAVCNLFYLGELEAVTPRPYYQTDSTAKTLVLKRNGQVKKSISLGETITISTISGNRLTGTLNEINREFVVVDQSRIPLAVIDWIKVKKKKGSTADSVFKWIAIVIGIAVVGLLTFSIGFVIAYAGGEGGIEFLGALLIGGLIALFVTLLSRKKYRMKKYDLEVKD